MRMLRTNHSRWYKNESIVASNSYSDQIPHSHQPIIIDKMGKPLAYTLFVIYALMMVMSFAAACQPHDAPCVGANGSQGNCCGGMHCQKNDPSWAEGRCYYNPGK